MFAVLLEPNDPPRKLRVGNHTLEARYLRPRDAPESQQPLHLTAAIFISTGPNEYYIAGKGVSITFSPNTPGPEFDGLATVEEGAFVNGRWTPGRRLAGDDTGQGASVDLHHKGIQRVTLYRYR
jgi:hypothetical protein